MAWQKSTEQESLSPFGHIFEVALIDLLISVALDFPIKRPVSVLDQRIYLPRCRTKSFRTSANFASKLMVMVLKLSAKHETHKSSLICAPPMLQGRTDSKSKTLELLHLQPPEVGACNHRSSSLATDDLCLQRTSIWDTRSRSWDR